MLESLPSPTSQINVGDEVFYIAPWKERGLPVPPARATLVGLVPRSEKVYLEFPRATGQEKGEIKLVKASNVRPLGWVQP